MIVKPSPLLCELHAHTTWSDGALMIHELVDLYGRSGFDVLAVTDHTVRDGRPSTHVPSRATARRSSPSASAHVSCTACC